MPQSFVEPQHISGNKFTIQGPEAHHIIRVLRLQPQDSIQIFDGTGRQYKGVLTRIDAKETTAEGQITEILSTSRSHHSFRLFQGLPKGPKFDFVLEKAVELGVDEIIPFISQKSLIKLSSDQGDQKRSRWNRLIKASAKQSNRTTLPALSCLSPLMELGSQISRGVSLLFSIDPKSRPLQQVLAEVKSRPSTELARINIIIGPESGFTDKETAWLVGLGARLTSLGELTLRTETAGLAALAILNYELNQI